MTSMFDVRFGQELCDVFAAELGLTCSFMAEQGRIVASSAQERVGSIHAIAARIMNGELDEYAVSAEEAAMSEKMREGVNLSIDFAGRRLINFGIAGPLASVRPLAKIVRFCITSLLRARQEEKALVDAFAVETGGVGAKMMALADDIEQIAAQVVQQQHLLRALQQGIRDLSSSNERIVGDISETLSGAERTTGQAEQSRLRVRSSLGLITDLVGMVTEGKSLMVELRGALNSVVGVADSIGHIAHLTKLLALNATIEAARAGESGRGFAVVAGEVKQLSQRTAEATGQIRETLGALSETAQRMIEQGDASAAKAEALSAQSQAIGGAIDEISNAVSGIAGRVGRACDDSADIHTKSSALIDAIDGAAASLEAFDQRLATTRVRLQDLLTSGECLAALTKQASSALPVSDLERRLSHA